MPEIPNERYRHYTPHTDSYGPRGTYRMPSAQTPSPFLAIAVDSAWVGAAHEDLAETPGDHSY